MLQLEKGNNLSPKYTVSKQADIPKIKAGQFTQGLSVAHEVDAWRQKTYLPF